VYGTLLTAIDKVPHVDRDIVDHYESDVSTILTNMLSDNRPGYGKERFTTFARVVAAHYPKILNNHKIFLTCSNLIVLATSSERANILTLFHNFLVKIETYSNSIKYIFNQRCPILVDRCHSDFARQHR
jgi:hypothetical protein